MRAAWDEENSNWWFSVLDIVGVLNDQDDYQKNRNYWKYLKTKLKGENSEVVSCTNQLKLLALDGFDNNIDPLTSDCWGAIADYDSAYNDYELSDHKYVVYEGRVFYPETDVNADVLVLGNNLSLHDPRNYNLKKHMVRLAVYELTKLIAPNNVSAVRMRDYEDSMKWLNDAAKLRLNPQIPRKVNETKKPVTDWQLATFQNDYDSYHNPWMV